MTADCVLAALRIDPVLEKLNPTKLLELTEKLAVIELDELSAFEADNT